jgi:hypothetical protein
MIFVREASAAVVPTRQSQPVPRRARGRTLKSLGQFSPDWIALGQLCLFRDPVPQLSVLSPLGAYRVASALASITADVRAAAS